MRQKIFVGLALLCLTVPGMATAAIYKWIDANGVITFRDTPPPAGGKVRNVEVRSDSPAPTPAGNLPAEKAAAPDDGANEPKAKATASSKPSYSTAQVELYVTDWCPYCKHAEAFLRERGVPFTAYDIEKDANAARRKDDLDSQKGVPFAIINGHKVHGFSDDAYQRALDAKE
ncbi:MAG: hypothetical protein A2005_02550 [Desulfuromonadales bacterium GWC2_61_20]|nr:MAG: hypothetical protein A2005_02550 [Desulfuromonadales bacterium GWC2_61_20]HAD05109.1 NrdH-like redox domain-containing protein [Desulfuromonas sp.]